MFLPSVSNVSNSLLNDSCQNSFPNSISNSNGIESLKLVFLNSQSIVAKRASLAVLLDDYDPDVIAVSETWLSSDISSSEFFPDGYYVFRKDRADGYGGVLLACRSSINCQELVFDNSAEAVVCKVTLNNCQPLIICSFYRAPYKDIQSIDNLCNLLQPSPQPIQMFLPGLSVTLTYQALTGQTITLKTLYILLFCAIL